MIKVYEQIFTEEDAQIALEVMRSGQLSSGQYSIELEKTFAEYTDRKYALSCCNGTAALYLALDALQIVNSHVAIPSCGYIAAAFAAAHLGNYITFIDAELDTWNLDPQKLYKACKKAIEEKNPIKAVIVIHNYGSPADIEAIIQLQKEFGFKIIEDACEALMAKFDNKLIGGFGDISLFSFYGNKICSSGEGGMLLTNDETYYNNMKLMRGQGQHPTRRFWHIVKGFNFRLTNLQSAIVLSQFRRKELTQAKKLLIKELYKHHLPKHLKMQGTLEKADHSWWMVSVMGDKPDFYKRCSLFLEENGVETRPIFPPVQSMPAFKEYGDQAFDNATILNNTCITLPSGPGSSEEDILKVCSLLKEFILFYYD